MDLPKLTPRKIVTALFDEYHSESWTVCQQRAAEVQPDRPENSSYQVAADSLAAREFVIERNINRLIDADLLHEKHVLAILHPCDQKYENTTSSNSPKLSGDEIKTIHAFVKQGGGLFVVSEYENDKYGNNLNELLTEFGITIDNTTVTDRVFGINEEKTHVAVSTENSGDNLLTGITKACFYRAGSCRARGQARILLAASTMARPKQAGLIAVAEYGLGRIVVVNDSDLFGDEYIQRFDHLKLWLNLFYWVSERSFGRSTTDRREEVVTAMPEWGELKLSVNALRGFHGQKRQTDNSYKVDTKQPEEITKLVTTIVRCIMFLKQYFVHDSDYLDQVVEDFRDWESTGFKKPNFIKSLNKFNPQTCRKENIEHLVVFPLYTPNNSLDIHFEALIIRVPWYDWLAMIENSWFPAIAKQLWPVIMGKNDLKFRNVKFVPGHLVDYTQGYHSECAVLFPETVSIDGPSSNNFGVIFCDREAKRYRSCVSTCANIVQLNTPPDLVCFLSSPDLVMDMFAAWDLVHDTSHSMGPLPFDPFMIRQLAPFWMYGLEELRVDLRSVRVGLKMADEGFPFGKAIAYGVLFDRIFRFAISGERVKNYDGLGGQLLFAALHRKKALTWENNQLSIVWNTVFQAMESLSSELEELYDKGADQSRVRRYIEGHRFVSGYVLPNINSKWQEPKSITCSEDNFKGWIALALNDEFPLGSFHIQLKKKFEAENAKRLECSASS